MNTNRSMPPSAVIPELPYSNIREATEWLCRVFSFKERLRIGNHRVQLTFGDGSLVVTQGGDSNASQTMIVRVNDVDYHFEKAQKAGAKIVSPPVDYPYGERQYVAEDFGGHRWTFSQTIADIDPSTWGGVLMED